MKKIAWFALLLLPYFSGTVLLPAASEASEAGTVLSTSRKVYVLRSEQKVDAKPRMPLLIKDAVLTDEKSRAKLSFVDDSILNLAELSRVEIEKYLYNPEKNRAKSIFKLIDGSLKVVVGRSDLEIHTKTAFAAARGTTFVIWNEKDEESVRSCAAVMEGEILFRNIREEIKKEAILTKDNMSCVAPGLPPQDAHPIDKKTLKRISDHTQVLGMATDVTKEPLSFHVPAYSAGGGSMASSIQAPLPVSQQPVQVLSTNPIIPATPPPLPPVTSPSPPLQPPPVPPITSPLQPPPVPPTVAPPAVPGEPPPPPPPPLPPPPEERR